MTNRVLDFDLNEDIAKMATLRSRLAMKNSDLQQAYADNAKLREQLELATLELEAIKWTMIGVQAQ